jgi:hypothetical protein
MFKKLTPTLTTLMTILLLLLSACGSGASTPQPTTAATTQATTVVPASATNAVTGTASANPTITPDHNNYNYIDPGDVSFLISTRGEIFAIRGQHFKAGIYTPDGIAYVVYRSPKDRLWYGWQGAPNAEQAILKVPSNKSQSPPNVSYCNAPCNGEFDALVGDPSKTADRKYAPVQYAALNIPNAILLDLDDRIEWAENWELCFQPGNDYSIPAHCVKPTSTPSATWTPTKTSTPTNTPWPTFTITHTPAPGTPSVTPFPPTFTLPPG